MSRRSRFISQELNVNLFTFDDHGIETTFPLGDVCYVQKYPTRLEVITKNAPHSFDGALEPICIPKSEAKKFMQAWSAFVEAGNRVAPTEASLVG